MIEVKRHAGSRELDVDLRGGWRLKVGVSWVHTHVCHDACPKVWPRWLRLKPSLVRLGGYRKDGTWGWRLWLYTRRRQPYVEVYCWRVNR